MAALKCKYCGGDVEQFPGNALGICSGCGSTMTLPDTEDPKRIAAHNFGNYCRRTGSFDKALTAYQKLLQEDGNDAEASWCSALCRFGIVYELDENFGGYRPVSKTSPEGDFLQDGDYLAALAHSGGAVKVQYEREATRIAGLFRSEAEQAAADEKDAMLLKQAYRLLEKQQWALADRLCSDYLQKHPEDAMAHLGRLLAQQHCSKPKGLAECTASFENSEHYKNALRYGSPELTKSLRTCCAQIQKRVQLEKLEEAYQRGCNAMLHASTQEQYRRIAALFSHLSGYRDSEAKEKECLEHADIANMDAQYLSAVACANTAKTAADLRKAIEMFYQTPGWRDADARMAACQEKLRAMGNPKPKKKRQSHWKQMLAVTAVAALLLGASGYLVVTEYIIPENKYKAAAAMYDDNDRPGAIAAFQALGTYKDSPDRALAIQKAWYAEAEARLGMSDFVRAASAFGGLKDYSDSYERCMNIWDSIAVRPKVAAGGWFTAALTADRTALGVGDNREGQLKLDDWYWAEAISAGWEHTVGLCADGTVFSAGYNGDGRGAVEDWTDIVAVSAGQWHTVGLRSDGTVVGTGCSNDGRLDFEGWTEMADISAGRNHTLGLRAGGTVSAVGYNRDGQCDTGDWTNITAIAAGGSHSVGLKMDGTVVAVGSNAEGQCQVGNWTNIQAIAAGYYHTVGLKADGTVVAVGLDEESQCAVSKWKDIVAIAAGGWHTVGLKADGTIVATGRNVRGQCDTVEWQKMMLPK